MKNLISLFVLGASAGCAVAQDANEKILDRMFDHYESLRGCSVELSMDIKSDDPMLSMMADQMGGATPGFAIKPNLFGFSPDGGGMGMPAVQIFCDGEEILSAVEDLSVYNRREAPGTFAELVALGVGGMSPSPWQMVPGSDIVFGLMSEDIRATFGEMFADVEYSGLAGEDLDTYHVLVAQQDAGMNGAGEVEIHVNAVGDPWLRAIKPDLTASGAPADLELLLTFSAWEEIEETPDGASLALQDDWEEVDDLFGAMMREMGGGAPPAPEAPPAPPAPQQGAGDTAPEFTLARLGGGEFSLAEQRGSVVVLDFWATWCGPCIAGLPSVDKVTAEFADRGVVLAAVNLRENPEQVSGFMRQKGWGFNVVMDSDGAIAAKYGVTGIPHSVIIDRQGQIRHVHVGFAGAAEYERRLRAELEELVAER